MRQRINIFTLLLALIAVCAVPLRAERASIKAKLDSAHLLMGNVTTLNIEVVKDRGTTGYFPIFAEDDNRPFVGLLGDSIELGRRYTSDTVELSAGRMQVNYRIPLQAFDSGFFSIPPIQYVAGADTISSNRVALKVLPVIVDPESDIEPFTDVADNEEQKWSDKLPDFIVNYWWVILLILIVIAGVIAGLIHYRRTGAFLPKPKPALTPYERAKKSLAELKQRNLWQQGQTDDYFVALSNILRTYIAGRFQVSAPEMTTQQFLMAASSDERLKQYAGELQRLLELADFVKFAKGQSLPDENTEAFKIVNDFVETTRPTPEEEEASKQAAANPAQAPSAGKPAGKAPKSKKGNKKKGAGKKGKEGSL
ncbi:MAG: hypothetical protein HDS66_05630 [Bacteroidales bacterium]|nr:hypothetical protein [Bacteroidales bacterium]